MPSASCRGRPTSGCSRHRTSDSGSVTAPAFNYLRVSSPETKVALRLTRTSLGDALVCSGHSTRRWPAMSEPSARREAGRRRPPECHSGTLPVAPQAHSTRTVSQPVPAATRKPQAAGPPVRRRVVFAWGPGVVVRVDDPGGRLLSDETGGAWSGPGTTSAKTSYELVSSPARPRGGCCPGVAVTIDSQRQSSPPPPPSDAVERHQRRRHPWQPGHLGPPAAGSHLLDLDDIAAAGDGVFESVGVHGE